MTPGDLLTMAAADGVHFSLSPSGRLKLSGDPLAINLWLGEIGQHEAELIAEIEHQCLLGLRPGANLSTNQPRKELQNEQSKS